MYLQKLNLINFKNFVSAELIFSEKINCFVGNNGEGKTNLLDSMYYLSFCKSYFNAMDSQNILYDAPFFVISGTYIKDGDKADTIYCAQKRNHRKQFKLNKKEYERLADHIGFYPLVIITPLDSNLIYGGSEERRKYIDSVISQFDKFYLDDLINYNKAVSQRNALLKRFAETRSYNKSSLEIWDEQMIKLGNKIHLKRIEFLNKFSPIFAEYYKFITEGKEEVSICYESQLTGGDFKELLTESIEKDRRFQFSTVGVHKDDFNFKIGNYPIKKFGSQGQQKSFLVSLKLAQFDYTKKLKGFNPVLLFDDIFDKLDYPRVKQLMKLVSDNNFGQIFITDTNKMRIDEIFKGIDINKKIFEIKAGTARDILD